MMLPIFDMLLLSGLALQEEWLILGFQLKIIKPELLIEGNSGASRVHLVATSVLGAKGDTRKLC